MSQTAYYYDRLSGCDPELATTRQNYAMKEVTLPSAERRERMTEFFFWTAWAASTERSPGAATYTNNWPHEPLIDKDRKSTRLNSSHVAISYAVFCLKKKMTQVLPCEEK